MRNCLLGSILPLVILTVTTIPAHAQTPPRAHCSNVATTGPDVDDIRQLELRGARVNVEGWTIEEAHDFFAPDFVSLAPDGAITRLETVLATFTDGRSAGWARSFDIIALEIRVYGCDAAVVIGTADVRALAAPPEAPAWRVRFLNMWRREAGHWRYTANQFARIATDSNGSALPDREH